MTKGKVVWTTVVCCTLLVFGTLGRSEAALCVEEGTVTIAWTAEEPADFSHYNVFRSVDNGGSWEEIATQVTTKTYTDRDIPTGEGNLCYKVTAEDGCLNKSDPSQTSDKARYDDVAPLPPGKPTISITPTS